MKMEVLDRGVQILNACNSKKTNSFGVFAVAR